jgi:hypothetical protein
VTSPRRPPLSGHVAAVMADANPLHEPFPGQNYFEIEQEALFFGRDREGVMLTHRVLSSRISVLHASSGAGKTSLLNARIIPGLERHGWMAVRARPEAHPSLAIRNAVLQYLLPTPQAELNALARAQRELGMPDSAALADLVQAYRELDEGDPRRQLIIAPVDAGVSPPVASTPANPHAAPARRMERSWLGRVLSEATDIAALMHEWKALRSGALLEDEQWRAFDELEDFGGPSPTLADLRQALASEEFGIGHQRVLAALSPPLPGLLPFFQNLTPWCDLLRPGAQFVLLLDQFEEIFTRFSDPGKLTSQSSRRRRRRVLQDWRLRREFFSELEMLYLASAGRHVGADGRPLDIVPIRFVLSLRDEYVSRLGAVRQFAPEIDDSTYRLDMLTLDQARVAIQGPAELRDRPVAGDCADEIIRVLQIEEAWVEPGPLQIVCRRIWKDAETKEKIELDVLQQAQGVERILADFFTEFLRDVHNALRPRAHPWPAEFVRLELLDLLSLLVVPVNRTRNVVEWHDLVEVPRRTGDLRAELLDVLEKQHVVRAEARLDGHYYEITHEFLIDPISEAISTSSDFGELALALTALTRGYEHLYDLMPPSLFRVLHRQRKLLVWDSRGREIMLRNAVVNADSEDGAEAVRFWAFAPIDATPDSHWSGSPDEIVGQRLLSRPQIATVSTLDRPAWASLKASHKARIFQSLLQLPTPLDERLLERLLHEAES